MHIQRIETGKSIGSTLMNLQDLGFGEGGKDYLNIFKNWKLHPNKLEKNIPINT